MEVLSPENQEPVKGIDAVWNRKSTAVLSCIQEKSRQRILETVRVTKRDEVICESGIACATHQNI